MIKRIFSLFIVVLVSSPVLATMRSLTPQEQMQTCYPSSPMLQSDSCWGQVSSLFPSAGNYNVSGGDPFSDLAVLMRALQGTGGMQGQGGFPSTSMEAFAGLNGAQPNLWDNSSYLGNGYWGGLNLSQQPQYPALPRVQ